MTEDQQSYQVTQGTWFTIWYEVLRGATRCYEHLLSAHIFCHIYEHIRRHSDPIPTIYSRKC